MRHRKKRENRVLYEGSGPAAPAFKEAIELTTRTIDLRARRFRNLVIGVILVGLLSLLWVALRRSWLPLLGILLLVPFCGAFFFLDGRLVLRWREQILDLWSEGSLDLGAFRKAMGEIRMLPARTVESMFVPDWEAWARARPDVRAALTETLKRIGACQADRVALVTLAWAAALVSGAIAVIRWSWQPLLGVLAVAPILVLGRWLSLNRFRNWSAEVVSKLQGDTAALEEFLRFTKRLDWESVPLTEKQRLLDSLRPGVFLPALGGTETVTRTETS